MMRRSTTIVLFALAACGQQTDSTAAAGVTLPTEPFERAQACTAAAASEVQALPSEADGRRPTAQLQEWAYYALQAARTRHGDALAYDQVIHQMDESAARLRSEPGFGGSRREETLAACRIAFPAASGQAAVTLPADADEAVLQCVAVARIWPALTRGNAADFEANLAEVQSFIEPVMGEIERIAVARNSQTEQEANRMFDQAFVRAIPLGRPDRVIETCRRRFGRAG